MSGIVIRHPNPEELVKLGIETWNPWSCEPSTFKWEYPAEEIAFVQEGRVTVQYEGGEAEIKAGDLVTFPRGMKCVWIVHEPIKKVYTFE